MTARTAARWSFPLLIVAAAGVAHGFEGKDAAALTAERDAAIEQVKTIVNQPVQALPFSTEERVGMYRPSWFHDGAGRPNFLVVDVRQSQQFPYDKFEYVASDINPGVMFRGHDLEFNANTKYFYTDRTVPKKRLTPEEMVEINRLYRIIGERERDLARLQAGQPMEPASPAPAPAPASAPDRNAAPFYAAAGAVVLMLGFVLYRVRAGRS
jgi:hypothetical protein